MRCEESSGALYRYSRLPHQRYGTQQGRGGYSLLQPRQTSHASTAASLSSRSRAWPVHLLLRQQQSPLRGLARPSGDQPEPLVVLGLSPEGLSLFCSILLRGSLGIQQWCFHVLRLTRHRRVNSKGFFLTT